MSITVNVAGSYPVGIGPATAAGEAPARGAGGARYVGDNGRYLRLLARGAALQVPTLGIYRFWLTTDMRRYLWSHTEVAGDRFEWTGRGRELLIGFLMAIALLVPAYLLLALAAFDRGLVGQMSTALAVLFVLVLGQYAVFRARRYRLSRTVYRGLRLHQSGSAVGYAALACACWLASILTLGLAWPWAIAATERYKMRRTSYGDLKGDFRSTGLGLFLRAGWMWLVVLGPLAGSIVFAASVVRFDDIFAMMNRTIPVEPRLGLAVGLAAGSVGWAVFSAVVLYPAFRALMMRWWISGLVIGPVTARSGFSVKRMYGLWFATFGYSTLFFIGMLAFGAVSAVLVWFSGVTEWQDSGVDIALGAAVVLFYVVLALGGWVIWHAVMMHRMWRHAWDTITLDGLDALDDVAASGKAASPLGEGLADALDVGGF